MPIGTINKKTLFRDQIRDKIMQAIISRELMPGDRIVETRWAKELGVSQAPVREAIRELEMMGYIENIPYKGSTVREITKEEVLESYKIRVGLERIAVEEACERITGEEKHELRTVLDEMEKAAAADDFDKYIECNARFHKTIVQASKNALLLRLWEQCNFESWTLFGTRISHQELPELAKRHEAIYDAVSSGDVENAIQVTKQHIEELLDGFKEE